MFEDDDDYLEEDHAFMEDLLRRFEALKSGNGGSMLDEEEFEKVAEYFFQNSREDQALLACEIARTYYPFSTSLLLLKAEILIASQKYGQALKALDEVDGYEAHNLDSILLRSDVLVSQFKHDAAAEILEKESPFFKGRELIELLLELADVYDEGEEFEKVFDTLKKVLERVPRHEEALQKICFWAEFTGRLEESIEIHTSLTEKDPYNALAWFNLGAAYQGLKLWEKAIDAYEFCVAIDENFEFAYRNMADAYMRLKWFERAIEVLEKHLEIAKPEDVIYEAMGYCWEKQKDFPKARHYYRQASRLSPQDDGIFYKIGETYAQEENWEKAAKAFGIALNLDKENASYCMALGNCLMAMEATSEALVCFLNAVRLKPNNKTTWVTLVRGLYMGGYYEEALTQLEIAREHLGDKPDLRYYDAAMLLETGKTKDALIQLETALRGAPKRIKTFLDLNPDYLRRAAVSELIARYKRS